MSGSSAAVYGQSEYAPALQITSASRARTVPSASSPARTR